MTTYGIQDAPLCASRYRHVHLVKSPSGVWTGRMWELGGVTEFHDRDLQVVLVKAAIHLHVEQEEIKPEFSESISALRTLFERSSGCVTRELVVIFGLIANTLRDAGFSKPEIELLLPGVVEKIDAWEVAAGGFGSRCS